METYIKNDNVFMNWKGGCTANEIFLLKKKKRYDS